MPSTRNKVATLVALLLTLRTSTHEPSSGSAQVLRAFGGFSVWALGLIGFRWFTGFIGLIGPVEFLRLMELIGFSGLGFRV